MAIDLEAIRKRVSQLNGTSRNSSVQLWKPGPGEYKIRGLANPSAPEGQPFVERWFYYFVKPAILAPNQFKKEDPINDLLRKLYSSGKPEDRAIAKKLQPKMRAYMPIIVRGQEDLGVQVFSFGKIIYQKLLNYFLDEEVGDILDPDGGFDLKVSITKAPGAEFADTEIDASRKSSPLSANPEQAKKWLSSIPNIDDMYQLKPVAEIEAVLQRWMSAGQGDETQADHSEGAKRGPGVEDELDKLANDVKSTSTKEMKTEAVKPAKAAKTKPAPVTDVDVDAPAPKKNIDDAFDELMSDDDS